MDRLVGTDLGRGRLDARRLAGRHRGAAADEVAGIAGLLAAAAVDAPTASAATLHAIMRPLAVGRDAVARANIPCHERALGAAPWDRHGADCRAPRLLCLSRAATARAGGASRAATHRTGMAAASLAKNSGGRPRHPWSGPGSLPSGVGCLRGGPRLCQVSRAATPPRPVPGPRRGR